MSNNFRDTLDALDDQARLLVVKGQANQVAKILSEAAIKAGGIADSTHDGASALHTAATKAEDLVCVVLCALDDIGLYGLQAAACAARKAASRRDQVNEARYGRG